MSKSRSSKDRGPKRKEKALARMLAHRASMGLDYDPQLRFINAAVTLDLDESVAADIMTSMVHDLPQETLEEKGAKIAFQTLPENSVLCKIPQDQQRWVSMKDGEPFCALCKKPGEGHVYSKQHFIRIEEDAMATIMSGLATSTRRFNNGIVDRL